MRQKLQLEKKKAQATMGGKDLSDEDLKRYDAIRNDKKRILENVIFPAMANLIFFFESIDQEPVLWETFKDDVEELLGIKRNGPSVDNYGKFFISLFRSILGTNSTYNKEDFRLALMHQALKIINTRMMIKILPARYQNVTGSDYIIQNIGQDMFRALSWTQNFSSEVKDPYNFRILRESEDIGKQREKFIEHAKLQSPKRTLDIDTKGILKRGY